MTSDFDTQKHDSDTSLTSDRTTQKTTSLDTQVGFSATSEPSRHSTAELMPCPFCGSKDIKTDLKGTQPSISCNDCGDGFVSIQTSDHFTDEERFNDPDFQFRYDPHFDYGIKGTQRALDVLTERWNTRYNADRLAELQELNESLKLANSDAQHQVRQLEAALDVPEGYKLVPTTPTAHMKNCGWAAVVSFSRTEREEEAAYQAMLDAAPSLEEIKQALQHKGEA